MPISLSDFVAGPNGEMNRIKVDEGIFDHVGKRISKGDTALYGRVWATEKVITFAKQHVLVHVERLLNMTENNNPIPITIGII